MIRTGNYYQLLPYVLLYFVANNFLLPHGLLYTTLLTPVFLYWLFREGRLGILLKWSVLLLIPLPFQVYGGVETKSFLISTTLVITAWVFFFAAIHAVTRLGPELRNTFRSVLLVNSALVIVALLILPISPLRDMMWYSIPISPDIPGFPRLKLLAYESSHYALLMTPVFLYFLLRVMTGRSEHPLLVLAAVFIPLALSLSFGVIGALTIAILLGSIPSFRKLPSLYWKYLFYSLLILSILGIMLYIAWPENPVYERMANIFSGTDTSAKGRLHDSFMFAFDLIREKKYIMGIGAGQIKILAHDLIINFYKYHGEYAEVVRIPNSMAEMLASYGFYGFLLKLFFQIYFFVRLKIHNNLYSLILFIFMFLYQFTGSFIVNIAELGTWAIIFCGKLNEFDMKDLNISPR